MPSKLNNLFLHKINFTQNVYFKKSEVENRDLFFQQIWVTFFNLKLTSAISAITENLHCDFDFLCKKTVLPLLKIYLKGENLA